MERSRGPSGFGATYPAGGLRESIAAADAAESCATADCMETVKAREKHVENATNLVFIARPPRRCDILSEMAMFENEGGCGSPNQRGGTSAAARCARLRGAGFVGMTGCAACHLVTIRLTTVCVASFTCLSGKASQ